MMNRVVVYGSLKRGFGNHRLLETAEFVGPCVFRGTMYSLGGFPAVSLHGDTQIVGELYDVDDATLSRLDGLEGFRGHGERNWYEREKIETNKGPAWVYTQDADQQLSSYPIVKSGVWE